MACGPTLGSCRCASSLRLRRATSYNTRHRLIEVEDQGSTTVSTFRYNGRGYRITMKYDADGDASIEAEEEYHFVYDTGWRAVMTRRYTDNNAGTPLYKDRIVYNNPG